MGYTNQYAHTTPSPTIVQAVIEDIERLISQSDTALDVSRKEGQIVINGSRPHNAQPSSGRSPPAPDGDTAYREYPEWTSDSCKTSRKKYDKVVFASLLTIKHHIPSAEIYTDDTIELDEVVYSIRNFDPSSQQRSVVQQLQRLRYNEFSKPHRAGIHLYQNAFPYRLTEHLLPWCPVI